MKFATAIEALIPHEIERTSNSKRLSSQSGGRITHLLKEDTN